MPLKETRSKTTPPLGRQVQWSELLGRSIVLMAALALCRVVAADTNDSTLSREVNLLLAPTSPGFVLLGVAPTTVERPGSVSDFAVSVANATNNLSTLPSNYAMEVAPYWLTSAARSLTSRDYVSHGSIWSSIRQTFSLSLATGSSLKASGTALGVGARFSPFRGEADTTFHGYADSMRLLDGLLRVDAHCLRTIEDTIRAHDTMLIRLQHTEPHGSPNIAAQEEDDESEAQDICDSIIKKDSSRTKRMRNLVGGLQLQRFGWKLDLAGGFVLNFPSSVFDSAEFGKSGAWVAGGYEDKDWSLIWTVRWLTGPAPMDTTSLDFGARWVLPAWRQLSPSVEAVYRAFPAPTPFIAQRFRCDLVFDVPIGSSKAVSITLGRDFGSSQSAKMLLLLNLLMGFGTNRPVPVI